MQACMALALSAPWAHSLCALHTTARREDYATPWEEGGSGRSIMKVCYIRQGPCKLAWSLPIHALGAHSLCAFHTTGRREDYATPWEEGGSGRCFMKTFSHVASVASLLAWCATQTFLIPFVLCLQHCCSMYALLKQRQLVLFPNVSLLQTLMILFHGVHR
jgi:hypothetical protein